MIDSPPDRPSHHTRLIGVDWGTSSLRAARLGADGEVLERTEQSAGLMTVQDGQFEQTLFAAIGEWIKSAPDAPVIASGMVTSRQGWQELDYAACPCDPDALADALGTVATASGATVYLITGVLCEREDGLPDVMRGEETQLAGIAHHASGDADAHTVVLPGTHSKWVRMHGESIRHFATAMTGELFAVLREHSILGLMMDAGSSATISSAFDTGVDLARDTSGRVLSRLFGTRTLALTGMLDTADTGDWLSGLLIGAEIAEMRNTHALDRVTLLGADSLVARYQRAFGRFGIKTTSSSADAAYKGHWRIARAASLV